MSENIYGYDPARSDAAPRIAFPALMQKVYTWMTLALAITALTAYVTMQNEALFYAIFSSKLTMWGLFGGALLLVIALSSAIQRLSFPVAGLLFALYSVLNGMTFSAILFLYTSESIATTFLVTAGTFGSMSLIGLFSKRDLTGVGRFFFMMLIGLIIATLVNLFMQSTALMWICSMAGVIIFSGLTAYDTQKMKDVLQQAEQMDQTDALKVSLLCSLELYLDFINLFLYLLRFLGDRE